jgi:adenylate cyclase
MTELNRASLYRSIRSVGVRQIRLACGLVLFAYLLSHFINHALGNISPDVLAAGVGYHTAFWRSLPITTVF